MSLKLLMKAVIKTLMPLLMNEYRIQAIIDAFHSGQHQLYTIESIYQKAGFKSKSSFQKAFKSKMGVTASHYLEHISHP